MSRLRTIKPGFFLDEELAECDPLARLLFAGLWTIADRRGRLEDRPRRIKVETLPYDDCDVDALLDQLQTHGFIVRYEADGRRYIAIPTWEKHQSPHLKETESTIPAPDKHGASTIQAPYEPPSSCLGSCLGSEIQEEQDLSSTAEAPDELVEPEVVDCEEDCEPLEVSVVSSLPAIDDGFEEFWSAYPRKEGSRKKAAVTWRRLTREKRRYALGVAQTMGSIVAAGAGPERRFIPLPTTFLNGEHWDGWREGVPANWMPPRSQADELDEVAREYAEAHGLEYAP